MFIQTEATRDPACLRFLPGVVVLPEGPRDFTDAAAARDSPLAARIFDVPGVAGVTLGADWVAVTLAAGADWGPLRPQVLGAIMEHFMSGAPVLRQIAAPTAGTGGQVDAIRAALTQVIDPELGYNIVDIGLIYDIAITDDGGAAVLMTTTTTGCPATDYLMAGARAAAASVVGAAPVQVDLTHQPRWTPDRMSPAAKAHFGITDGGAW